MEVLKKISLSIIVIAILVYLMTLLSQSPIKVKRSEHIKKMPECYKELMENENWMDSVKHPQYIYTFLDTLDKDTDEEMVVTMVIDYPNEEWEKAKRIKGDTIKAVLVKSPKTHIISINGFFYLKSDICKSYVDWDVFVKHSKWSNADIEAIKKHIDFDKIHLSF